jgi:hypothetical protein
VVLVLFQVGFSTAPFGRVFGWQKKKNKTDEIEMNRETG